MMMKYIKIMQALLLFLPALARAQGFDINTAKLNPAVDNINYWKQMAKRGLAPQFRTTGPFIPAVNKSSLIDAPSASFVNSPDVAITTSNEQTENSVFVNPNNIANALNSNNSLVSGTYRTSSYWTFNNGTTWTGQNSVDPGSFADPAVVIDNNNNWYINYIDQGWQQWLAKSTNNGATWTANLVADPFGGLADKNHMMIDNSITSAYQGNLYNAWTLFSGPGPGEQQIWFNRSTNGGTVWSAPVNISGPLGGALDQGVNIQTGPNGEVYATWISYDGFPQDEKRLAFIKSADGGATFSAPINALANIRGVRATGTGKSMRMNSFPSMAVDNSFGPNRGTVYIVWTNIGVPGVNTGTDADIYIIKSTNGGTNWSTPVRVNGGPAGAQSYFGWISCDPKTGTLNVIFYDDRNVGGLQIEAWVATSCNGGNNWTDFRVSDVAFTPNVGAGFGYFGDYLGIAAYDNVVYPVWTDNRSGAPLAYTSPFILSDTCNCATSLTIQNVVFPINFTKHYKASNTINVAGGGTTVKLVGDGVGVNGAKVTLQAGNSVTLNGGFSTELGAVLKIRMAGCDTTITARQANDVLPGFTDPKFSTIVNKSADELERMSAMGENYYLVYPNPVKNVLTIYLPASKANQRRELVIASLMGNRVHQQILKPGQTNIDVSKLPRGGYFVIVSGAAGKQFTRKIILQ
jgi:hypothetical protein